ncbi:uncharacterized protein F4822DRAFT_414190 [Hypoxylon trugodes]|uniref:uncharacterized protein n=1 Tax=Hypoxylon trugodes TaxID=326681 RepID=UPI0021A244EE|nr:uncharacterized protein F4822DRAFT_414190 [Hypoxylon trugodes]KAI1385802.1 hypothetical protein F4822DRAFT_414190 [Hypoxylon trugodes]
MQFTTAALSLFVAVAAAQNSTLPDLVSQLPTCAAGCLNSSAQSAGCATTDFACLCGDKRESFISSITGCIALSSGCSGDDISKLQTLAPEICQAESANPDPAAVASASGIVASAVGTATPTSTPNAAAGSEIGMGLMGVAALAALAL